MLSIIWQIEDILGTNLAEAGVMDSVEFSVTTKSCVNASLIASSVIGILSRISLFGLFSSAWNVIVRTVSSKSFRSVRE